MDRRMRRIIPGLTVIGWTTLSGCGGAGGDAPDAARSPSTPAPASATAAAPAEPAPAAEPASPQPIQVAAAEPVVPPTLSTTAAKPEQRSEAPRQMTSAGEVTQVAAEGSSLTFAAQGTVDWRLYQIADLLAPPSTRETVTTADGTEELRDRDPEVVAAERKERLKKVIDHASKVIAATHSDPQRQTHFTNGMRYLCLAHVELAIAGEADHARALGEVAEAVYREQPDSDAAVEAGYRLVDLARRMADLYGRQNVEWVRAYATQARVFAERFQRATNRVATSLIDAADACELAGLTADARSCCELVCSLYPDSIFADEIATDLRRLTLEGRLLTAEHFAGRTIDGGYYSIEQSRGKSVLVVFWMTNSPTFLRDLPTIRQLEQSLGDRLQVVGVNLDHDEFAVDSFIADQGLGWKQIFDSSPANRGADNPVAKYYGIAAVPLYWLIDREGQVVKAPATLDELQKAIANLP